MVWTDVTDQKHNRNYSRYPSDFSDAEWAVVEKLVSLPLNQTLKRKNRIFIME